jgi:response regulator of citrate/malate metabolism
MLLNQDVILIDRFLDEDDKGMTGLDYFDKIEKGFKYVEVIMISATK